jgi:hypothetical protein
VKNDRGYFEEGDFRRLRRFALAARARSTCTARIRSHPANPNQYTFMALHGAASMPLRVVGGKYVKLMKYEMLSRHA